MLRPTLYAVVVYVFGAVGLLYWSLAGFNAGVPREDWALMIVLPAAWIISFWPMFGTLLMIWKFRGIQSALQRMVDRIRDEGEADTRDMVALEDLAVELVAREYQLPGFLARPFVRKVLSRLAPQLVESCQEEPSKAIQG